ncbi:MAG: iron-sulfur cluster assembly accessory protein [Chloroflexi bacterium]|nr:iron-sulfur cluster assembly accessory protein [Chloroflexota bacterium]
MIEITELALEKLKTILHEEGTTDAALRVIVVPGGHGFQYMLTAEAEPKGDDVVTVLNGLRVVVDSESAPLVEGARIDYIDELERTGFVIANPNAPQAEGCACGGNACSCGGNACSCGGH